MTSCSVEEFLEACVIYQCAGRDVRIAEQRINRVVFDRRNIDDIYLILSGSFADGMPLDVCGDIDVMGLHAGFPVVLNDPATDDTASHIPHTGYVIAEGNPRQPAYLTLTVPDIKNVHSRVKKAVVRDTEGSRRYLDLQTMLHDREDEEVGTVIHGPALMKMVGDSSLDIVPSLPCPSWPPCAADFLHRHRPHGRPSHTLMQRIRDAGCHVVAKGHPDSHQRELECRWSFSVAEKELIHSMDSNMSAAMYVLKVFKKRVWSEDSSPDKPTGICSYHFKTACLWLNEMILYTTDTPSLTIASEAIEWLVKCYEEHNLSHYFIPSHNLIGHLPLDTCKEVADILKAQKERLELRVLNYCVKDNRMTAMFKNIKKQIHFPKEADLSDTDIAAAFLTIVREHENSREYLATATARISPGSEMYRRKELESVDSFFAFHMWNRDVAELLSHSQRCEIPLTDVPEHLILPVIDNLDDLVEKGCVAMIRSLLYRYMASLYHGLAMFFSGRVSDCMAVAFSGSETFVTSEGSPMRLCLGWPTFTSSALRNIYLGELISIFKKGLSILVIFFIGSLLRLDTVPEIPISLYGSPASLCQKRADIGSNQYHSLTSDRKQETTELGFEHSNYSVVGLTTPLPAANDPRDDLSTERHCLAKAEEYYRRGIPLVCPNGYDDEGFSGHVYLAAFFYLSEQWDKAEDTLDTEQVQSRLAGITEGEVITSAASHIHIYKATELATLPWQHDERLYQRLLQGGDMTAEIDPAVLALYLQARLALRRGDVSRAESVLARMTEIRKTIKHRLRVNSADILTELLVCELSIWQS